MTRMRDVVRSGAMGREPFAKSALHQPVAWVTKVLFSPSRKDGLMNRSQRLASSVVHKLTKAELSELCELSERVPHA